MVATGAIWNSGSSMEQTNGAVETLQMRRERGQRGGTEGRRAGHNGNEGDEGSVGIVSGNEGREGDERDEGLRSFIPTSEYGMLLFEVDFVL